MQSAFVEFGNIEEAVNCLEWLNAEPRPQLQGKTVRAYFSRKNTIEGESNMSKKLRDEHRPSQELNGGAGRESPKDELHASRVLFVDGFVPK